MGKEIKILEAQMNKSMYEALIKGHYAEKKAGRVFDDLKYQNEIVEAWFDMVIFVFNLVVGMGILYFTYVYYEKEEKEEKKRAEAEMIARLHQETSGIEKQIEQLTIRVSEIEQKNETTEALLHRVLFLLQADHATKKLQEAKIISFYTLLLHFFSNNIFSKLLEQQLHSLSASFPQYSITSFAPHTV